MDIEVFKKLARQLADFPSRIALCGMGNPLLHPEFKEIVGFYRDFGKEKIGVVVNVNSLCSEVVDTLIESRPDFIEISFPTIDPDLYEKLNPGLSLTMAIEALAKFCLKRGSKIGITICGIHTSFEKSSKDVFLQFWKEKEINARIFDCHSRGGNLDYQLFNTESGKNIDSCGLFATHSFITWEGKLLHCCHDLDGSSQIADLNEISLMDAAKIKIDILKSHMKRFSRCRNCDESAALRQIPDRPFPETAKQKKSYFKTLK